MTGLPSVALSIRQPWAWLVANGLKDIENRDWHTKFRGPVLIHAGLKVEREPLADLFTGSHPVTGEGFNVIPDLVAARPLLPSGIADPAKSLPVGGIVGVAEIVDCVDASDSPWFVGAYGFVIANARPLPFMPLKGMLGFFKAEYLPPS